MIAFEEKAHSYTSLSPDGVNWLSVTGLISQFKKPFDGPSQAAKSAKNSKSKWYGMSPKAIQDAWKKEADRACDLGHWYHAREENRLLDLKDIGGLPVFQGITDESGRKIAPVQKLAPGIYPEHMVFLKSAGICGQSDLVTVTEDGFVHITDYKTNKEIKKTSYVNWEGLSQKMNAPLVHLDDCNLNHYTLQLSTYLYMILKHNPMLKPGKLTIQHISFHEEDEKDEFGFPIAQLDEFGEPMVKAIGLYDLPYLNSEVRSMIAWLADNPDKIKRKS